MTKQTFFLTLAVCLVITAGCSSRGGRDGGIRSDTGAPDGGDSSTISGCSAGGPAVTCTGNVELNCNPDGTVASMRTCPTEGLVCAPGLGCRTCLPGRGSCDGNTTRTCNDDGNGYTNGETCDAAAGLSCNPSLGACTSPCADAESSNSYIGCEYWPTTTSNSSLADEFEFAVVVTNPNAAEAQVQVTRGGSPVSDIRVAPGAVQVIPLPYVPELKNTSGSELTILARSGAYRLVSTLPVTVYQFNPLEYRIARDCASETFPSMDPFDNACFSFTNDASLLLPTHVLTGNYMVISRPSLTIDQPGFGLSSLPGFFAVIGVEETPTAVSIDFAAHTLASADGSVRAFRPGENGMFMLNQGDVLQVLSGAPSTCTSPSPCGSGLTCCLNGADYDLTGSIVRAAAGSRVAVIGGHNCTFIPYDRFACDHLEEALFPLEAWGTDYIIGATEKLRGEPNVIRVVSGHDGNSITFDPASVHGPVTLGRGEVLEFETDADFRVQGSAAFSVVQHLVGQNYAGSAELEGNGDPALSLGIPTEQYRTSYDFLAPDTYVLNYVNVTAPSGSTVTLDGAPVGGFRDVGGTGFATARVEINGGAHHIESGQPFGIVVYGFGSYTSYMYPGGLDFEAINIPF